MGEIARSRAPWRPGECHVRHALFIATVPEGTEFYHGTSSAEPKTGMDWLAFESEHALIFARPGSNRIPDEDHDEEKALPYGYLHTFRTRHDLRLLYIDGVSAAKSDRGTLDLQDVVLLGQLHESRQDDAAHMNMRKTSPGFLSCAV